MILQIMCLLLFAPLLFGQTPTMTFYLKDGRILEYQIEKIDSITFSTNSAGNCGTLTVDYGGEIYHTVLIGNQCWLKENLNIGKKIDGLTNASNNGVLEKFCYNDDELLCNSLGALYRWGEIIDYDTTNTRGICPKGWHIPTDVEAQTLYDAVGGSGNALKAIGEGEGSGSGTNISGFSALLAGNRDYLYGKYDNLGVSTSFWLSKGINSGVAKYMGIIGSYDNIILYEADDAIGYSVRCLKN